MGRSALQILVSMVVIAVAFAFFTTAAAQDEDVCPIVLDAALETVEQACSTVGGNSACYGHEFITANLRPGGDALQFENPGDQVDVMRLDSLRLSAINPVEETWGIAKLRLRATTNASQLADMNILAFGGVDARNSVAARSVLPGRVVADASQNVNLRSSPTQDSFVAASLLPGTILSVVGTLEDGSWYRVEVPTLNVHGWLVGDLVELDGDPAVLLVETGFEAYFSPMQAFVLQGQQIDGSLICDGIPLDGLLIQTPQGPAQVRVYINEISVDLLPVATGSALLVQPVQEATGETIQFNVLQGISTITTDNGTSTAIEGTVVSVPIDQSGMPIGEPSVPMGYDPTFVGQVPVAGLGQAIVIAEPPSEDIIAGYNVSPWVSVDPIDEGATNNTETSTQESGNIAEPIGRDESDDDDDDSDGGGNEPEEGRDEPDDGRDEPDDGEDEPDDGGDEPDDGGDGPDDGGDEPDDDDEDEDDDEDD